MEDVSSFSSRCLSMFNGSCTTLNMVVGHSVGLFDAMARIATQDAPKTSLEIALEANLKERYVREWLCTMVCGDVVECDSSGSKFWLPSHRAEVLRSDNPESVLSMAMFTPLFAKAIEPVVKCFKPEGPRGVAYSEYSSFQKLMAEYSDVFLSSKLVSDILPRVPGLEQQLASGINCLDVGCGGGLASRLMGKKFPSSTFWGIDISHEAIAGCVRDAQGLGNVHFEQMDGAQMKPEWGAAFDLVTAFDAIHDLAYPDKMLAEVWRLLKPGGRFVAMEVRGSSNCYTDKQEQPMATLAYTFSLLHCMPVSLYFEDGMGLGAMWGKEQAKELLKSTGFTLEDTIDLPGGEENVLYICTKK